MQNIYFILLLNRTESTHTQKEEEKKRKKTNNKAPYTRPRPPSSLCFEGHFPGEPGLAGFIGAEDDGDGGDNWSYKMCRTVIVWESVCVCVFLLSD